MHISALAVLQWFACSEKCCMASAQASLNACYASQHHPPPFSLLRHFVFLLLRFSILLFQHCTFQMHCASCRSCLQNGCSTNQRPDRARHCPKGDRVPQTKGSCKGRYPFDGQLAYWIAYWETKGTWHPIALVKCWQAFGVQSEGWHPCQ